MFSTFKGAKEWASSLLEAPPSSSSAQLDQFLDEVNRSNAEHLYFHPEVNHAFEIEECQPTYEQLLQSSINVEADRNVMILKSFETILQERIQAHERFLGGFSKTSSIFEHLQSCDGSMRQAYDSLYVFIEQELQQARQQLVMGTVRKQLTEIKVNTQKRLNDYHREVANGEKEVQNAEARVAKAKQALARLAEQQERLRSRSESFSTYGDSGANDIDENVFTTPAALAAAERADAPASNKRSARSVEASFQEYQRGKALEKIKGLEEDMSKVESDIETSVRALLRAINKRDGVHVASRRAHQRLDFECKVTVKNTLQSFVEREKESIQARVQSLEKLETAVKGIDLDSDIAEFIAMHTVEVGDYTPGNSGDCSNDGPLVQSSQALSIIDDIMFVGKDKEREEAEAGSQSSSISSSQQSTDEEEEEKKKKPEEATPDNMHTEIEAQLRELFAAINGGVGGTVTPEEYGLSRLDALPAGNNGPQDAIHYAHNFALSASLEQKAVPFYVEKAVVKLGTLVKEQRGRDVFATVLNQYRSKKCDVGHGYAALNALMWQTLDECADPPHDVHTAKVIMMLSQTFYTSEEGGKKEKEKEKERRDGLCEEEGFGSRESSRQYLKDYLLPHPLWQDAKYWELLLWECTIEQLHTIPYPVRWYDMQERERKEAVKRVHEVLTSQVMAVEHSMLELGCDQKLVREFVYRMCALHQLGEGQRHLLLNHLQARTRAGT
jgi:hypothetical protein